MSKRDEAIELADVLDEITSLYPESSPRPDREAVKAVSEAAALLRQWPEQPSPRLPENGMIFDGTVPFAQPERIAALESPTNAGKWARRYAKVLDQNNSLKVRNKELEAAAREALAALTAVNLYAFIAAEYENHLTAAIAALDKVLGEKT